MQASGDDADANVRGGNQCEQVIQLFDLILYTSERVSQHAFLDNECESAVSIAQDLLSFHAGGHSVGNVVHLDTASLDGAQNIFGISKSLQKSRKEPRGI